jgi:glycosyltransferase involved in cell wall biosynthesis
MSNPRIYIVIATFHPYVGGTEKQALAQGHSLRERGYEATIVTFSYSRTWPQREVIEGVPVIRVADLLLNDREKLPRFLQKLVYLLAMLIMGWTLWRQRHYYDLLHVYQLNFLTLVVAMLCRLAGKPMLVAIRSADSGSSSSHDKTSLLAGPLDVTAPCLQVDERLQAYNGRVKVGSDLEMLARVGKPVVRLLAALLRSNSVVVVLLSSRMKSSLAQYGFHPRHMRHIPNGVDITRFNAIHTDHALDGREQVVVCVSKLRFEKGIDVLLQAWCLVHQQAPQARLIIVGDGSLRFQLECMAKALDIANCVELMGLQSDIPAQLHRGSLAVLPSRWEGMPNALLEAMACGLPCVATRVSGSEDIIEHGVNGLLVESEDYRDMAQALLTLLHNPVLAQKFGQAARKTVERHYSLEQVMDRYIELYQSVAEFGCLAVGDTSPTRTSQLSS